MDYVELNGRHIVRPEQAADLLGLTPRQVLNIARSGKIATVWFGRQIWYYADSVNAERAARHQRKAERATSRLVETAHPRRGPEEGN